MNNQDYLDALLSLPALSGATLSHDGKWVAWTWYRTAPTSEVYVTATDGSTKPIRLTDTLENTFLAGWTPDSQSVLVKQDKGGNERVRIYRVDLDKPLVMHPLIEDDPNYFIRGGELHPNGKWLIYGANVDVATGEEIEATVVIRHDLATGERLELARPKTGGWNYPRLSPDGSKILYDTHEHPAGAQEIVIHSDGTHNQEVLNMGADKKVFGEWANDSKTIIFNAEKDTYDRIGMLRDDEITWLIDDPHRNIEGFSIARGSDLIIIYESKNARTIPTLLNLETGQELGLPDVAGTLNPIGAINETEWIAMYYSSTQPSDIVRFSLDATSVDDFVSLSNVWQRTTLTADDLAPAEDFRWQSTDGLGIQGWLYRAENPRGTIVYVHGGPTAHSRDAINNQIQFFVRQGFHVLDPNYRGSTGFGLPYREKIKDDHWGGLEQVDIEMGIKALIAQGIAEVGKVGMTGTSYGGYSAWHGITHFDTDTLAASAPICGMTDLVVDYNTTRPDLRPYSEAMLGGNPEQNPDIYYERSPINFVHQIKGRLLIIQGMRDPNVHPDNVAEVRQKLDAEGIEHGLLAFDDEGHGISKPKNQKILYQELASFFESAFA